MADLLCSVSDCIHRSKRKSKKWRHSSGAPMYGCTCQAVVIMKVFDADGDIEAVAGKENTAICGSYHPMRTEEQES